MSRVMPGRVHSVLSVLAACTIATACVTAPPLVIVDRKTALEEQAAGSFHGLSADLSQSGVSAAPVAYTRGQLESAGVSVGKADEELGETEATTDSDLVDQLLTRRCFGEALDGSLADTPTTCTEPLAPSQQARLLERENRRRWQIWRSIIGSTRAAGHERTIDEVRAAWRVAHFGEVICGGQVQAASGGWEAKKC